ncbi:hypothetical protein HID58_041805 [Brassica napus]|uniref:K Homology domain-containing protein n=1 Tax=Brassica napus TaxID=3708 RepID=A0ABQ8BCW3_BRANA|nr:hypothetical protein HID58_041805 [Brassica napus]
MSAVADSVKNGPLNLPENENLRPSGVSATAFPNENSGAAERWPGFPGDCVFRVIIPGHKVGAITGRQGEFIRKLWQETRARIQVLDGPVKTPYRLVIISGKEKPEAKMSPAMDAVVRVFRRVSSLPDNDDDVQNAGSAFSSMRLLVPGMQASSLIGKQGSIIRSIVQNSGASVRILSQDATPCYAAKDERIVAFHGEALKIVKALEAVVGHLRKYLVDHFVIPFFEEEYLARVFQEDGALADKNPSLHAEPSNVTDYDSWLLARREALVLEGKNRVESRVQPSGVLFTQEDPIFSAIEVRICYGMVCQTVRAPICYSDDIIGAQGANINYIRWRSGAILIVEESLNPGEMILVIKGTFSQVEIAYQLIQELVSTQKYPVSVSGGNARIDTGNVPVHPPQLSSRQEPLSSSYMGTETEPNACSQVTGPSPSRH